MKSLQFWRFYGEQVVCSIVSETPVIRANPEGSETLHYFKGGFANDSKSNSCARAE